MLEITPFKAEQAPDSHAANPALRADLADFSNYFTSQRTSDKSLTINPDSSLVFDTKSLYSDSGNNKLSQSSTQQLGRAEVTDAVFNQYKIW